MELGKDRSAIYDYAKAIGILLVIYNHCSAVFGGKFISTFHIPLFFILSGICNSKSNHFHELSFRQYLKRKINSLLLPYYIFGVIDFLIYLLVSSWLFNKENSILKEWIFFILGIRNYRYYYFTGALWFLTALFSCEMLCFVIVRYLSTKHQIVIIIILVFVAGCVNHYDWLDNALVMNIDTLPYVIPLWYIGYWAGKSNLLDKISKYKYVSTIFFAISVYIVTAINGGIDIFSRTYGTVLLFYIGGILGSFGVITACIIVDMIACNGIKKILNYIGNNSLMYMAIHQQWILHPINSYKIELDNPYLNCIMRLSLCLALSTICCVWWDKMKRKMKREESKARKEVAINHKVERENFSG